MEDGTGHRILVLNRLWQAVNIIQYKRAFSLLVQDHAKVIHTGDGSFRMMDAVEWIEYSRQNPPAEEDPVVRTVQMAIRLPKVIILRFYDRLPAKEARFNRRSIFERDEYRCQYCGERFHERELNLDHVIPRDRGGRTSWENVVTSCIDCNSRKANRLPHEARMQLMSKPDKPKWRPFVSSLLGKDTDEEWTCFLNAMPK